MPEATQDRSWAEWRRGEETLEAAIWLKFSLEMDWILLRVFQQCEKDPEYQRIVRESVAKEKRLAQIKEALGAGWV